MLQEPCLDRDGTKAPMGLTKSRNNYGDQTGFAMQIHIRYEDGSEEDNFTDEHMEGV